MKMPNNTVDDTELVQFFSSLKEKDKLIPIPQLPQVKKRKILEFIPYGIAASILFAVWFFSEQPNNYQLDQNIIIITLNQDENQELKFKIETTTELEIWEPSTSSLLTEF